MKLSKPCMNCGDNDWIYKGSLLEPETGEKKTVFQCKNCGVMRKAKW